MYKSSVSIHLNKIEKNQIVYQVPTDVKAFILVWSAGQVFVLNIKRNNKNTFNIN